MRKVYLDNAACTPVDERVKEAILEGKKAVISNVPAPAAETK